MTSLVQWQVFFLTNSICYCVVQILIKRFRNKIYLKLFCEHCAFYNGYRVVFVCSLNLQNYIVFEGE